MYRARSRPHKQAEAVFLHPLSLPNLPVFFIQCWALNPWFAHGTHFLDTESTCGHPLRLLTYCGVLIVDQFVHHLTNGSYP